MEICAGIFEKNRRQCKIVDRAQAIAQTKPGTVGVKVSILSPHAPLTDKIKIDEELLNKLRNSSGEEKEEQKEKKKSTKKTPRKKKTIKKK
ncbi:MAG TPA: hypothetical protein ENG87_04340 [Candidatus Pacearchaeota archaeon]|nr:hypothetical protein [Candidatus Pacearchaeota archaeon]